MKLTKKVLLLILFFSMVSLYYNISIISDEDLTSVTADIKPLEPNQLLVSFLPLTIGEATLIQLSNNQFYLIDTGNSSSTKELIGMLSEHGVQKLDGIILTSFSEDHLGGLNKVLQSFYVSKIYLPELIYSSFKIPKNLSTEIITLKADEELWLSNNVRMHILAPNEPLSLSPQANSLVFQLVHKEIRFLFTSEINGEIEQILVDKYNLDSEILKVSDYGNNTGTITTFIEEVDPQIGVIFSSDPELYRLSEDVLSKLHETWIDVYVLEDYGELRIISDGTNYQIEKTKRF